MSRMALTVVMLASLGSGGCRGSRAPQSEPAPSASIAPPVAASSVAPAAGLLGLVVAPQTVDVTAQLDGRLLAVVVRAGDHVERGALLARLDGRNARQELAMARAELATAEAERERARLDVAQAAERVARRDTVVQLPSEAVGTVSQEELSSSKYQHRIAEAKLASAEAAVAQKRARFEQVVLMVREGALRAPFDGVVVVRYVDAGSTVHRGTPVVRLLESGELKVRFAIPEESADDVQIGSAVQVAVGSETLSAAVEKIAPEVDAASRMVFAEASLSLPESPRHRVRSGQVARVLIHPPLASAAQ